MGILFLENRSSITETLFCEDLTLLLLKSLLLLVITKNLTMITQEFSKSFANEWINAWNSHDLDLILSHYSDDFTITTPIALSLFPESKGIVKGKEAVKAYWKVGLERIPNLKFELLDVLVGINGLTLYYKNTATGRKSAEMMHFNSDLKVNKAHVHYTEN